MNAAADYFFCGVGGSGMSPLAAILHSQGLSVSGSDRSRDQGQTPEKFRQLETFGIRLFPQDGSGLVPGTGRLVVSSAIEDAIPDVQAARRLDIPIVKRAEVLAMLFSQRRGIAIGGTSGKTTVTGMAGWLFTACGLDPAVVNGGVMLNFSSEGPGNFHAGKGEWFIAETDESDGSIALFTPDIAVLNNITLDHKPVEELRALFGDFVGKAVTGAVVNLDDREAAALIGANKNTIGFGIDHPHADLIATGIRMTEDGSAFELVDRRNGGRASCSLNVPGRHNVSNALAATGAALLAGVSLDRAAAGLAGFKGIRRRLEKLGHVNGVTVIDDFAHNPDKIAATLETLTQTPGRLLVLFQPHGFGPMRMMRKELAEAFASGLRPDDILIMPEILYLGGTAKRDISSRDLIADVAAKDRQAFFAETREEAGQRLCVLARPGDRIVIMGARDDSLSDFGRDLLARIGGTKKDVA
jgi:UDP-N-acetylmuramate--alanine ligase